MRACPAELAALDKIDWEPAFRNGNLWYNRIAAASRLKDRSQREREFDKIDEDLKAVKKSATAQAGLVAQVLAGKDPGKSVGTAIGSVMISLWTPAVRKVQNAADRDEQIQRNLHVAFALAAYRADNGRYPAKLDELAPRYLASVPGDIFSGKPLIYRPAANGYLFYSVGVNGQDEGGRWFDDDPPGDDPGVRMPLPELKRKK